MSIKFQK